MTDAEEDENQEPSCGADPAVVKYRTIARNEYDLIPCGGVVNFRPGIRTMLWRQVGVEDVELQGGQDEDHDDGHERKAEEA